MGLPAKLDFTQFFVLLLIRAGDLGKKFCREFDNRPPDTGSTVYSELANQPTRKALSTYVVYSKNRHKVGRWSRIMKSKQTKEAQVQQFLREIVIITF